MRQSFEKECLFGLVVGYWGNKVIAQAYLSANWRR